MIDSKKLSQEVGGCTIGIILLGLIGGILYACWHVKYFDILCLIFSPIISYYLIKHKVAITGKNDFVIICLAIFLMSCAVSYIFLEDHDKITCDIKNIFIPGRIITTKEFVEGGEDDDGRSWEDHYDYEYKFVPSSKKYEALIDVIDWTCLVLMIAVPIINFRLSQKAEAKKIKKYENYN